MESLDELVARAASAAVAEAVAQLQPQREWLDTVAAAAYLGCSTQLLEIARHKGEGPPYSRITKRIRYKRSDLDDWMLKRRVEPEAA
jgi:hypothetical protein